MKRFKKLTIVTTASLLLCLTTNFETDRPLPIPSITVETYEGQPLDTIQPMSDDDNDVKKIFS